MALTRFFGTQKNCVKENCFIVGVLKKTKKWDFLTSKVHFLIKMYCIENSYRFFDKNFKFFFSEKSVLDRILTHFLVL